MPRGSQGCDIIPPPYLIICCHFRCIPASLPSSCSLFLYHSSPRCISQINLNVKNICALVRFCFKPSLPCIYIPEDNAIYRDRWETADENEDNALDSEEFISFMHPEHSERMLNIVVDEILHELGKFHELLPKNCEYAIFH